MKKISDGTTVSIKDENGLYVPSHLIPKPTEDSVGTSIDDLLNSGLQAIRGALKAVLADINTGVPERETIMNLRDIMAMLRDLKKEEKDLIDNMSDDQLAAILKTNAK